MLAKSGFRAFCLLAILATGRPASGDLPASGLHTFSTPTMGTYGDITVAAPDSSAGIDLASIGFAEFSHVDSLLSNWTDTSETARINRARDGVLTVHPDFARVLDAALRIGLDSNGAFDVTVEPLVRAWGFLRGSPRVPSVTELDAARRQLGADRLQLDADRLTRTQPFPRIDLGGIAKGHAVDRAREALARAGVESALVNVSGNMVALGAPPGRDTWTVGVRDPRDRVSHFARLRLDDRGLATSGNYEQFVARDGKRYGHILDPRTGWPAQGIDATTVLAPTALEADGWATALLVMGIDAAKELVSRTDGLDCVLVQSATHLPQIVWVSEGLRSTFSVEAGMSRWFEVRFF